MYQLFQNDKPYAYAPAETLRDAITDLQMEYDSCARSSGTETISDIEDNSFTVSTAAGKTYVYSIEQL